MNYRILALIGVRLLAIWLIVVAISQLAQLGNDWFWWATYILHGSDAMRTTNSSLNSTAYRWQLSAATLSVVVPLLLGIWLWFLSSRLSRWMAPAGDAKAPAGAGGDLVQGAIAIAGLVIAVTTLPNLIYKVINVIYKAVESHQYTVPSNYTAEISLQLWAQLAVQAILVLLGLGMVVGARRLRDWIYRLRALGTSGADQ